MPEQIARVGGIDIAYETFGDDSDPALLLIMGLGTQMLGWDARFCRLLAERGFHIVRFDNRDVGRSSHIEGAPAPRPLAALRGDLSSAGYTLSDMAGDGVGLLDHLGIERAHLVGASMGGMIAQTITIERPERVLSLTSLYSTTGEQDKGQPRDEALPVLLRPAPAGREEYADYVIEIVRVIGSPAYPPDEEHVREYARLAFDRAAPDPRGVGRQLMAILASGDRTARLRELDVPAVVIHGEDDPLITISGGEATAAAIPGAEFIRVPGMGHDLPPELWPRLADAIEAVAARAGARAPS